MYREETVILQDICKSKHLEKMAEITVREAYRINCVKKTVIVGNTLI